MAHIGFAQNSLTILDPEGLSPQNAEASPSYIAVVYHILEDLLKYFRSYIASKSQALNPIES